MYLLIISVKVVPLILQIFFPITLLGTNLSKGLRVQEALQRALPRALFTFYGINYVLGSELYV